MSPSITPLRSYRCFLTPLTDRGLPILSESGTQPFIQLKAPSAEAAQRAAHHVTGNPVADVERMEEVAA